MCLVATPLFIKRKLIRSYACPVLYGSCFARVPRLPWASLCDMVWCICFGRTRGVASKHLRMPACYGAHLWMQHVCTPLLPMLLELDLPDSPSRSRRLIDGWILWCKSFQGKAIGADVHVDDRVVLHSSLSSSAWKHEVRHLHCVAALYLVNRKSRNLVG
eukprot:157925-Amphidinium_carterae.2